MPHQTVILALDPVFAMNPRSAFRSKVKFTLVTLLFCSVLLRCGGKEDPSVSAPNPRPNPVGAGVRTVTDRVDVPWEILWGPDNFIWMTEHYGRVSRLNPDTGEQLPLLILDDCHQRGESGLLGMALHPNFSTQPYVYLVYTYQNNGGIAERLVRYRYNGTALTDRQVLLENIPGNVYHDGSRLLITPQHLWMTTGDAGNPDTSQDPASLAGKILRLNLDGSAPADNPFPNRYVWSSGHRNPQGLLLHPNGQIYSSEHGPNSDDEINVIVRGGNYGWPNVLGPVNNPNEQTFAGQRAVRGSILDWTPTIAPSDLVYYASSAIPQWQNRLLMTALKNQTLIAVTLNADGTAVTGQERYFTGQLGRLRDICVSPDGRVFLASNGTPDGSANRFNRRIVEVLRVD